MCAGPEYSPEVWKVEQFNVNDVTILLGWHQEDDVTYNVSVVPDPQEFSLTGNTSVQLTVPYNTSYSVYVTATRCGISRTVQTVVEISANPHLGEFYSTCTVIVLYKGIQSLYHMTLVRSWFCIVYKVAKLRIDYTI